MGLLLLPLTTATAAPPSGPAIPIPSIPAGQSADPPRTQIPAGAPAPIPATPHYNPSEPAPTTWSRFPASSPDRVAPPASGGGVPAVTTSLPKIPVPAQPLGGYVNVPQSDSRKLDSSTANTDRRTEEEKRADATRDRLQKDQQTLDQPYVAGDVPVPTKDLIFRLDSDQELDKRILREVKARKDDKLPQITPVGTPHTYQAKTSSYPPIRRNLEPNYIIHRPLYFEEPNAERTGWDLGAIQPFVSTAYFFRDFAMIPHNFFAYRHRNNWDTDAGKCPPGGYTPYYLYPPGFTVAGLMGASTFYTGFTFIFP